MKRFMIRTALLMLPLCLLFESEPPQEGIDELIGSIDLSGWDEWFRKEASEIPFQPSDFVREIAASDGWQNETDWMDRAAAFVLPEVTAATGKLILFLGLGVLIAVTGGLHASDGTMQTAQTALRFAVACVVLTVAAEEVKTVFRMLNRIETLSEWLLPVLLGFLTLTGMEHSASALSPAFAMLSGGVMHLLRDVAAPLCCIGGVLLAFDANATGRLASLGKLFLRAAKWLLALLSFGYGLWSAMRGSVAASADGLLFRSAKGAAGSFPVIGGIASDSIDTAYQCLQFVRRVLGVGGTVLLLLVFAKPVLSVFLSRCSFRIASAACEPLSGRSYAELLRGLGDMLHVLLLCELAAVSMSLLAIAPVFWMGTA